MVVCSAEAPNTGRRAGWGVGRHFLFAEMRFSVERGGGGGSGRFVAGYKNRRVEEGRWEGGKRHERTKEWARRGGGERRETLTQPWGWGYEAGRGEGGRLVGRVVGEVVKAEEEVLVLVGEGRPVAGR